MMLHAVVPCDGRPTFILNIRASFRSLLLACSDDRLRSVCLLVGWLLHLRSVLLCSVLFEFQFIVNADTRWYRRRSLVVAFDVRNRSRVSYRDFLLLSIDNEFSIGT